MRPAPVVEPRAVAEVRRLFAEAEYTAEGIRAAMGVAGERLANAYERPVHLRRLTDDGPLATLIRLFVLDQELPEAEFERALGAVRGEALETLGLVERERGSLRATARLVPHGDLVIASDLPSEDATPDHVPGVHRPSALLAHLTLRRQVASALDVGTGSGVQAILASRHSERVIGTDTNERALEYAALNAALNGAENVEFQLGSYLEPVRGRKFDLVVSNPPYVISPESAFLYRDSGLGRDRVSEELLRELPSVLTEGGFATVTVSWVSEPEGQPVRPLEWVSGTGVDALVLHTATEDPLETAGVWNRNLAEDEVAYAEAIDRWVDYYRAEGITALAYGSVIMRRRSNEPNWARSFRLPLRPVEAADTHLRRLFAAQDFLESATDGGALLSERFDVVEGAVLEQRSRKAPDGWGSAATAILLEDGLRFSAELDPPAAAVVAALDGARPLAEVLTEAADALGLDPDAMLASGAALLRRLLETGFVERVGPGVPEK